MDWSLILWRNWTNLESTPTSLRVDSWTFILWALTYSTENVGTSIKKKDVNFNCWWEKFTSPKERKRPKEVVIRIPIEEF